MNEEVKEKKTKIVYRRIDDYELYLKHLIDERNSFIVHKTSYTRKIKEGGLTTIFNKEGDSDFNVLSLINMVKEDAKKYLKNVGVPDFDKDDIFWSSLTERPPKTLVTKVDIRGAYWDFALKNKIISQETNEYLKIHFDKNEKLKQARLKALGSLATKKEIINYIDGKIIEPENYEDKYEVNEETRKLYIFICKGIDSLMREIAYGIPGAFFYYWDCIFTDQNTTPEVIKYIQSQKYSVRSETTKIDIITIGSHKYIQSAEDLKVYLIKPEQKHLLYE